MKEKYSKLIYVILTFQAIALILLGDGYFNLYFTYMDALDRYDIIVDEYTLLVSSCNSTNIAYGWLNDTIEEKVVPSMAELETWIANDTTDLFEYSIDFDCFHYGAALALHGREEHFQIGVLAIYGREGNPDGADFFHVINAIVTDEGLVYIEPQLDAIWSLEGHSEMKGGKTYSFPGFGYVYVEGIKIVFNY